MVSYFMLYRCARQAEPIRPSSKIGFAVWDMRDEGVYSWGLKCISWKHGLVIDRNSNNICNRSVCTLFSAVSCQADDTSLKQDPLGGGGVPLGGRVGVGDIKDGIEDEGEN